MAAPAAKVGWGTYFASYVKKKPPGDIAATAASPKAEEVTEKPPGSKTNVANGGTSISAATVNTVTAVRKPTDGFQRSNSSAKKLYAIPKEPVVKEALTMQRSGSNAGRLANMFGYATVKTNATPTPPEPVQELPVAPLVAMVEGPVVKKPEPKVMPIVEAVLKYRKDTAAVPAKPKSKKDEVQDMLDFFASQLDAPSDSLALPSDKEVDVPKPEVRKDNEKKTIPKPVRAKPKAADMLDFFASQLDSVDDMFALPDDKKIDIPKTAPTPAQPAEKKAIGPIPVVHEKRQVVQVMDDTKPVVQQSPQVAQVRDFHATLFSANTYQKETTIPPLTRKDSLWSQQSSRTSSRTSSEIKMAMSDRKNSFSSRQGSRTSSELKMTMNRRKDSVWSRQGSHTSSELSVVMNEWRSQTEQDVVQIRERVLQSEERDEQLKLERERREAERERMVQLEKQAATIIFEREQMDVERQKMLEEQLKFEEEATRIAEEEESMRKFMENVERERQLDLENQEKKRKRREAEEQARREDEEAERRRIAEEEEAEWKRIEAEEQAIRDAVFAAEIEAERAAGEAERAEIEIEKERKRVEELNRKEQFQAEEDRLAKEEADRLTAKMTKYEEEKEAERRFYEEEEDRKRDVAKQKRRAAKIREEQLRYEEELAEEEERAREDERIEKQNRRTVKERADRLYEQEEEERSRAIGADRLADAYRIDLDIVSKPMLSPSVYEEEDDEEEEERQETKEEKLAKAEEKIRMAFASLAEERAQQTRAALPRSNTVRDDGRDVRNKNNGMQAAGNGPRGLRADVRLERGVSRYNTTGGAGPRPAIRGGLPSGPRAAGLPTGPRPRRQ